jgi:hypothetical protein
MTVLVSTTTVRCLTSLVTEAGRGAVGTDRPAACAGVGVAGAGLAGVTVAEAFEAAAWLVAAGAIVAGRFGAGKNH